MAKSKVQLVKFKKSLAKGFAEVNKAWINENFRIENIDLKYLDNPQKEIIDKGGQIFLMMLDKDVIGSIAMIKFKNSSFKLEKLVVAKEHRGNGYANELMQAAIDFAKENNCKKIFTETNQKLIAAVSLLHKYEFVEVPMEPTPYSRPNIRMELELSETEKDKFLDSIEEEDIVTIGSKMKRVTDLILNTSQEYYSRNSLVLSNGKNFKPVWCTILLTLRRTDNLDIKTLAKIRKITHSGASHLIKEMASNKLVKVVSCKQDQRHKKVMITEEGKRVLDRAVTFLRVMKKTFQEILGEDYKKFFSQLETIEDELRDKPYWSRDSKSTN